MSARPNPDHAITQWLRDEADAGAPDRLIAAVRTQLESTDQRRVWWPARRLSHMNTTMRLLSGAAAVAVVALIGVLALPRSSGPGNPPASPTSTASQASSPTGASAPPPSGAAQTLHDGVLPAGTYLVNPSAGPVWTACPQPRTPGCDDPIAANAIRVTMTVPDGWAGMRGAVWLASAHASPPGGASVGFNRGNWLHSDPCRTDLALPTIEVGPTVEDFANGLADHPLLDVTTPVDATLAGYSGKYVDLQVPADTSGCPTSYFPWEPGIYAQGPSQRWHLWILDVKSVRVVIQTTDYAGTSAPNRAALEAIVNSIQIQT